MSTQTAIIPLANNIDIPEASKQLVLSSLLLTDTHPSSFQEGYTSINEDRIWPYLTDSYTRLSRTVLICTFILNQSPTIGHME